jgi:hypothetical protein
MTAVEEESQVEAAPLARAGSWWTDLSAPLLIFSTSRVVQLLLLGWVESGDSTIKSRLLSWDGGWFIRVATEGYPHGYTYDESGQLSANGLAFFPLYPLLIRGVHALGADPGSAALIISWLAAAAAVCLIYLLGIELFDRRAALALTVLFATAPMSIVLSMAYTESLFCALVLGMFYAARRNAYLIAGVLGFLAGMTRPTGLAAALALAVAAGLAVRRRTVAPWRPIVGALVALAGVPAYLLWVGLRVGEMNAWFKIQTAGWGTTFDWGSSTWDFVYTAFHQGEQWVQVSVAIIIVVATAAAILAVRRTWPPLAVYGLLALILVVGQAGYYHSKPRLLFPVLITLIPAALLAARSRPRAVALGLAAYAAFGLWYGAYLVAVWKFTI